MKGDTVVGGSSDRRARGGAGSIRLGVGGAGLLSVGLLVTYVASVGGLGGSGTAPTPPPSPPPATGSSADPTVLRPDHATSIRLEADRSMCEHTADGGVQQLNLQVHGDDTGCPFLIPSSSKTNLPPAGQLRLVIGIPSVDSPVGAERRRFQRDSWHRFRGVWKRAPSSRPITQEQDGVDGRQPHTRRPRSSSSSSEEGFAIVCYVLALHPSQNYVGVSDALQAEAALHDDIVGLRLREGRPATGKKAGQAGYWGLEAEVGMSRKAYYWYRYALTAYPHADYVMKADDDLFLRVQVLLRALDRLPKTKLYWGPAMRWKAEKNNPKSTFAFVGGMSIILSRDLATWFTTSDRGRVNQEPFRGDTPKEKLKYKSTNHDHEDVMVGRAFYDGSVPHTVVSDCRFHDIHAGARKRAVTDDSVGIHHLKQSAAEYQQFQRRFAQDDREDSKSPAVGQAQRVVEAVERPGSQQQSRRDVHLVKVC